MLDKMPELDAESWTLIVTVIGAASGYLTFFKRGKAKPKVRLEVQEKKRTGEPNLYTIFNRGDMKASLESVYLVCRPLPWGRHTRIQCSPTSAHLLANRTGGIPNISDALDSGDFIEVSIGAGKDPISNVLKQALAVQQRGIWHLEIKARHRKRMMKFHVTTPTP